METLKLRLRVKRMPVLVSDFCIATHLSTHVHSHTNVYTCTAKLLIDF